MRSDENEFFRQAALRICGTLDIGKALGDFMAFVKGFIPISELALVHFDTGLAFIQNLVTVSSSGKTRVVPPIPTPPDMAQLIESRQRDWREKGQAVTIDANPKKDPVLKTALPYFETVDPSAMSMLLVMDDVVLGVAGVFAEGPGIFTPRHARLFALLREPFAVAMSNALRYEEVLRLKDMVDAENRELNREMLHSSGEDVVGSEYGLAGVMEMVRQIAPLSSPVMLLGETGVGKEVIANAIHRLSTRRDAPFIKVNCGAIPEGLLDAELFGHEKGAFTGAIVQKRGRFERADKGTIFLDEIGDLPLAAQVRLLRVLQHKEIERVGGIQTIGVDVRIISATNKNLESMVCAGTFREDLWYRLNLFPITIPPLRQRTGDIPALAHHFVEKKARELKIHTPPAISSEGVKNLKAYGWPGNVRELENLIERELIRSRGMPEIRLLDFEQNLPAGNRAQSQRMPAKTMGSLILDEAMANHILYVLELTKGKLHGPDGAASLMGINPNTLRNRMKKLGISARKSYSK